MFFFIENMIDEEAFLLLEEEALKEMISAVGPRIKLQKKIRELQVILQYSNLENLEVWGKAPNNSTGSNYHDI